MRSIRELLTGKPLSSAPTPPDDRPDPSPVMASEIVSEVMSEMEDKARTLDPLFDQALLLPLTPQRAFFKPWPESKYCPHAQTLPTPDPMILMCRKCSALVHLPITITSTRIVPWPPKESK